MEFMWNDGGRAACGFVGTTGDCVTRAISIATGSVYRDVYTELGEASQKSPRRGMPVDIAASYLAKRDWQHCDGLGKTFDGEGLPDGVVILHLSSPQRRAHHFCTVVDHVVHDTWDPSDDEDYVINRYWIPAKCSDEAAPSAGPKRRISQAQELTQQEFDKIIRRLRALERTASNRASTEGEKRNALRMIYNLMLTNNLTREDIVDRDNVDSVQFTRVACPVNGRRACKWEKGLAMYLVEEILPAVQFYRRTKGHRTLLWFYGPLSDVHNAITLFRDMLLTIAAAAQLQYRYYDRCSGASYAEGYVRGLPRPSSDSTKKEAPNADQGELIQTRMLAVRDAATDWLHHECDFKVRMGSRRGRYRHDSKAESRGRVHGASHEVKVPDAPKRIANRK
ncbi:MAG: DUF2786 domain-containing protein [Pirellulaceae bacterium]|nr:DUF2786 domain-containing protein [Pirellulaceae bacterium]